MKKFFTAITAAAVVMTLCVTASAAADLNDGVYNIDVESDSSMFKIVNCDLTVENGKRTVAVTLSGTGYSKLFVGTAEQAATADESALIPFTENSEGKYVYTFELPALGLEVNMAAYSAKKGEWYDRKLIFKPDRIPETAYRNVRITEPSAPFDPEPSAPSDNPDTGAVGLFAVAVPAAAAIVFRRKK